jgi:hypothetical protein
MALQQYDNYSMQRQFYFDHFQMQGEGPFVYEQFGIYLYIPDYIGIDYGYSLWPPGALFMFRPELQARINFLGAVGTNGYWQSYARRYNPYGSFTLDSSSRDMDVANIRDDWTSYMFRYEEHKRDVLNERRWASQMGALSYGVKEAYEVAEGLAVSFDIFDKAQGDLINEGNTALNGLATFAGYRQIQKALDKDLGSDPTLYDHFFLGR